MTARRSSATERRGIAVSWRRPTAILLAFSTATSVAAGVAGCASRQSSTGQLVGKTLPGNQDTAAAQQQLAAPPTTPPGQSTPYGHLSPPGNPKNNGHAVPPTTITSSPSTAWADDPAAVLAMGNDIITKPPPLRGSPSQNPASPKPQLEIITMPMWLWVDPVIEQTTVTATGHTVLVRTVVDSAVWFLDTNKTPLLNCAQGAATTPSRGPGTPYITDYDPTNAGNVVPQACIYQVGPTPYYSTSAGTQVAGVHNFTATVTWHVEYEYLDTATGTVNTPWTAAVPAIAGTVAAAPANALTFRVGEIQALAIGP
jgi:hypothetical protein